MPLEHAHCMRIALDEARRGKAAGNVAVGSIIVQGDTVLARGRNLVTSTHDPTAHAETVALREAGAATQREDVAGCTLYTTFGPCPMCCGALLASGLSPLVMGARPAPGSGRWGSYTVEGLIDFVGRSRTIQVVTGVLVQACADIRQGEGQTRSGQGLAHGAKERHRRRLRWQQSAEALWEHGWGWEHRG